MGVPISFRQYQRVSRQSHRSRLKTDTKPPDVPSLVFLVAKTKRQHADQSPTIHAHAVVLNDDAHIILGIDHFRKLYDVDVYGFGSTLRVLRATFERERTRASVSRSVASKRRKSSENEIHRASQNRIAPLRKRTYRSVPRAPLTATRDSWRYLRSKTTRRSASVSLQSPRLAVSAIVPILRDRAPLSPRFPLTSLTHSSASAGAPSSVP